MGDKKRIDDKDFPVTTENEKIKSQDGEDIAVAENEDIAEDVAERLNDDAWRRHEESWSA